MKTLRLGGICADFSCAACCKKTEMLLSLEDITRIEQLGFSREHFCVNLPDGFRCLRNIDDHCVFLKDNRCIIYADRPQGCRFYPIVFDIDSMKAILDSDCPLISTISQNTMRVFEKELKQFIKKIFIEKDMVI